MQSHSDNFIGKAALKSDQAVLTFLLIPFGFTGKMKLLIIEPEAGGHHFLPYLQYFSKAAQAQDISILLMTSASAAAHPAMALLQNSLVKPIEICLMPEVPGIKSGGTMALFARQRLAYQAVEIGFSKIPKQAQPEHIIMMCMDGFDRWFALFGSPFGSITYSGLYIGVKFHLHALAIAPAGRLAAIHQWLFRRFVLQKKLYAAATIDESLLEFYKAQPGILKKLRFVPDPGEVALIESQSAARIGLEIPLDKFVVLMYGGISLRKNITGLLEAAAATPAAFVILAGRMDEEAQQICQSSAHGNQLRAENRLLCFNQFIEPALESTLFSASDCVWLCYASDFYGQSAVLAQAASAQKPILARSGGQIGFTCRKHELGICAAPDQPDEIQAALRQLIGDESLRERFIANAVKFATARSAKAFGNAMLALIPSKAAAIP